MHEKDNLAILKMCGASHATAFPNATIWDNSVVMWNTEIGKVVEDDIGATEWATLETTVRTKYGAEKGDFAKHSLFIGYCLTEAWEQAKKAPTLEKLCKAIIDFAKAARKVAAPAKPVVTATLAEAVI